MKKLKPLLKYIKKHKTRLAASILFILATDLLALAIPWVLRLAIDNIRDFPQDPRLLMFASILVGISAIEGVARFYMRKLLIGVSRKIEYSLRCDFFSNLQKQESRFFIKNRTGSLMALMTNDLEAVRNFLGPGLLNLFNTIFVFISTLTVMFFINVRLSLFSLIAIPVLPILVSRLSAMLYKRFKKSQEQYAHLSAKTQESIAGIKVIKSFTQEENEIEDFSGINTEYVKRNLSLAKVRSVFWPAMIFIGGIGTLVVLLVGGRQVINGVLTIGQFVQFSAYIGAITWPLISLGWVVNLVQRGSVSMGRITEVMDRDAKIKDPKRPVKKEKIKGSIKFDKVYFSYGSNGSDWILKDIDVSIEHGATVGVVGYTGSGKSSLVNLIPRLYDPQKGVVSVDGVDIRRFSLEDLRSRIGYVIQEPFLFSKSIKENITFGKESLLSGAGKEEIDERIEEVSRISHLHEDVKDFPDGYDTMVGERGVTLSGGQKQRLAIARALIISPSILILDDSFSSVDTNTEEMILNDLRSSTKGMTTIIISHRISTIKNSDLIIVMDEGAIDCTGDHDSLLDFCDIYRTLYYRQQLSDELKEEV